MVGADYAALNLDALKPGGRWVVIATLAGALAEIDLARLMMKRVVLTGSTLRAPSRRREGAADRRRRGDGLALGRGRRGQAAGRATFPLERPAAHLRLEAGGHVGKIVLTRLTYRVTATARRDRAQRRDPVVERRVVQVADVCR